MRLLYIISLSLAMGILTGDSLATKRIVPGTYSTIRSAVDAAVDGDTILVQSNAVYDPVDITKDLTIMAASGYKPALRQIANDAVYDYGLQVWRHDDNSTTTLRCIGMTFNGAAVSSGINTSPLGIRYGCVVILDGCTVNPASTNKAAVEGRCYQLTVENSTIGRGVNGRAIEWANLTQPVSTRYDYDPDSHDCGETETELTLADSFIFGSCNAVALGSVDVTRCTFDGSNDVSVALYFTDVTGSIAVTNSAFMNFTSRVISPGQCPSTFTHNLTWSIGSGEACSVSGTTNLLGVDPLFCDEHEDTVKKYSLRIDSPCVAGNNEWNEGIGHNDGVECAWGTLARNTTVPTKTFVRVLEDVLVPSGKTLTVAPGAELRFDGGDNSGGGSDASKNELIVEYILALPR